MPASRLMLNNLLNYNFGSRGYSPALPADVYFGLSTVLITDSSNLVASVTAMSYTLKVVTLTCTNIFAVGDIITVAGVNTGFTVTNIDGAAWVCQTGTDTTKVVFTVTSQPVGTTPQTISVGTVSGAVVSEPPEYVDAVLSLYARAAYSNDASPQQWTVSSIASLANTVAVTFPESGTAWGTALSIFIADASAVGTGNILWYYTLNPSIIVQASTIVSFAIGDIVATLT